MANDFTIKNQTLIEFGQFVQLFNQMIDLLSQGLSALRQLSLSNDYRYLVVISLMHEAQRSVLAASDLWSRGYYSQALAVARPTFESFLLCKWLELHPERAMDVLNGSKNERFNYFRSMAKEIDEKHPKSVEVGFSIYHWYDEVSDRVHPRASMIAPSLLILEDNSGEVYLGPRFRLDIAKQVARYIGLLVYVLPGTFESYLQEYGDPTLVNKFRSEREGIEAEFARVLEAWR